jgi:hypothetical protein
MSKSTISIKQAIDEARFERDQLLEVLKGYEKTKQRVAQLDTFINTGIALIGDDIPKDDGQLELIQPPQPTEEAKQETYDSQTAIVMPLLDGMITILKQSSRPLSLNEIADEFRRQNWKISEKNSREVLRAVIIRHPDKFTKAMDGNRVVLGIKEDGSSQ